MSNPSILLTPPPKEDTTTTLLNRVPWREGPWNEKDTKQYDAKFTVFVLVKCEDGGTENGQSNGRETKEGEEKKDSFVRSAEQKAKGANISACSLMDDQELAGNEDSVVMAGRLRKLRQSASMLTEKEVEKKVSNIIDDVMTYGGRARHVWKLVSGTSVEGLKPVDLDDVATEGGYVSEADDDPLSGEVSEDDQ